MTYHTRFYYTYLSMSLSLLRLSSLTFLILRGRGWARVQTVMIDNLSDPMATIVVIEFGDYLGDMLDTVRASRYFVLCLSPTRASL